MREELSVPVIGPSTIFPRGYLWLAPVYCAAAIGGLALARWLPLWFRGTAAAALLTGMLTLVAVLTQITARAFYADRSGVRLGLPPSTRRRGRRRRTIRQIPWPQVEKVRVNRRRGGAVIEFILGPDATLALRGYHHNPVWRARRAMLLMIPFWYLLRPTGLTSPLPGPARYQVRVTGMPADQIAHELRALAPANVTVTVKVRGRASVSSATPVPGAVGWTA